VGERRALVIGARNDLFGKLTFVEEVARDLHATLMDDRLGACLPALPCGRDLLIGGAASCAGIKSALGEAMHAAALDRATLFVYFLGHGCREDEDFYLIAGDTPGQGPVDSDTAIAIGQRVKELLRLNASIDGLMLVLDACHSGSAVTDPVPGLLRSGVAARMEILAATRQDQTASNGCLSRAIIGLLKTGSTSTADAYLCAYDEHSRLRDVAPDDCADMPVVVHVSLGGGVDAGLWLGRNHAADLSPALTGTSAGAEVARLTRSLVRTDLLDRLIALRWTGFSPIAVKGGPGVGKSTLLAALGRGSVVGYGGVDALVAVRPGDTLATIAVVMNDQLRTSASYQNAYVRWVEQTPAIDRNSRSVFDRLISGPIANLGEGDRVIVGVDGIDLLATLDRRRLLETFTGRPGAILVVAGREITDVDESASVVLPDRDPGAVAKFLASLVNDENARDFIMRACAGDWLMARILVGLWRAGRLS
jgi:hypothetical protein